MKSTALVLTAAMFLLAGCGKKEEPTAAKPTNNYSSGNPLTAPVDYLGAVAQAKKHAEGTLDLVSINQAVQTFASEEGRYPKNLQELVAQKYLPRLPEPPYRMTYAYNPATGQTKLVPAPAAPAKR